MRTTPTRPKARGFTLLELMMVVSIIAIGASMAMYSYENLVCRAQETEVKAGLEAIAVSQESYRAEYGRYAPVSPACAGASPCIEYRSKGSKARYTFWGIGAVNTYTVWGSGQFGTSVWGSLWKLTESSVTDVTKQCTATGCDATSLDEPAFGALLLVVLAVRRRRHRPSAGR